MAAVCGMLNGHQLQQFLPMGLHAQPELDPKKQICFDFTKGTCMRGDSCKYSHDLAHIVQVNSQERGICFDFLRGQCSRGLLCRFSHDLSSIVAQQQIQGATAAAKRGAPICYDFVKGMCARGAECRYSHDITSLMHSSRARPPGSSEPCFDFLRGKCSRGQNCRYSHSLPMMQPGAWPGGVPLAPGPPLALNGLPHSLPTLPPQVACVPPPLGMPLHGALPLTAIGLRPSASQAGTTHGVYGGANAAACAMASRFPLQQLGADAARCGSLPSNLFAPTQQNFHLMAHMAALQAANSVASQSAHQFATTQPTASQAPLSRAASHHSCQEALADDMRKLQLSQQQARAPAAKGVLLNTGCSSASEDFDDEDRIRAVWDAHRLRLPQLATHPRGSLPQSGTCTPGACTPRTPALPAHHPFSGLARQGSNGSARLAAANAAASTQAMGSNGGWELQMAAGGSATSASLESAIMQSLPPYPVQLPDQLQPRDATRSTFAVNTQSSIRPQPATAPAGLPHPFAAEACAMPLARAHSQPTSARAAAAEAHNPFAAAASLAFEMGPASSEASHPQAQQLSTASRIADVQAQVQSWLNQPERPSSATIADPQLLSRLQTIWQPQ